MALLKKVTQKIRIRGAAGGRASVAGRAAEIALATPTPLLVAVGKAKACVHVLLATVLNAIGDDVLQHQPNSNTGQPPNSYVHVARNRVAMFGALQHEIRALRKRYLEAINGCFSPDAVSEQLRRLCRSLTCGGGQLKLDAVRWSGERSETVANVGRIANWYPQCFVKELAQATIDDIERYAHTEARLQQISDRPGGLVEVTDHFRYTARYAEIALRSFYGDEARAAIWERELAEFLRSVTLDGGHVRLESSGRHSDLSERGAGVGFGSESLHYRQAYLPLNALLRPQRYWIGRAIRREDVPPQVVLEESAGWTTGIVNTIETASAAEYGGAETYFAVHHLAYLQRQLAEWVDAAGLEATVTSIATREFSILEGRYRQHRRVFESTFRRYDQSVDSEGLAEILKVLMVSEYDAALPKLDPEALSAFASSALDRLFGAESRRLEARRNPPLIVFTFPSPPKGVIATSEVRAMKAAQEIQEIFGRFQQRNDLNLHYFLEDQDALRRTHDDLRQIVRLLFYFRELVLWEPECRGVSHRCLNEIVRPCFDMILHYAESCPPSSAFLLAWYLNEGGEDPAEWTFRRCARILIELVPEHLDVLGHADAVRLVGIVDAIKRQLADLDVLTDRLRQEFLDNCREP